MKSPLRSSFRIDTHHLHSILLGKTSSGLSPETAKEVTIQSYKAKGVDTGGMKN